MSDNVLAYLYPSPARRIFGLSTLIALGGFIAWVALTAAEMPLGWRLFLLAMALLILLLSEKMRRATRGHLELTRTELRDDAGRALARVDNIASIDRGVFAFKPSSGFRLRLSQPIPRAWAPGLYWCFGRSLGIGGVTAGNEGKYMAEVIAAMLAERASK